MNRTSFRNLLPVISLGTLFATIQPAFGQDKPGRKVALLVAVQDYADTGLTNLKYTENDIAALAGVLKGQGYKDGDVVVLTDTAAAEKKKLKLMPTAANVRATLRGLIEDLRPEDTFVAAFSGHGAHLKRMSENGLHFCAKGTDLDKPETMVSLADVYDQLDKHCRAGVKVLFVDACRNDPTDGKSGDGRLASLTRPLVPDPPGGTVAFFSCSTGQKSYESDTLKHGVFFHHVIEGLKGGPADDQIAKRGEVTVPLLEDYLTRAVPVAVKKDKDDLTARQVPERRGSLRGQVVLATVNRLPGEAEYLKAVQLLTGLGGPIDEREALAWYRKAADLSHPIAAMAVANVYVRTGKFVDKNEAEADRLVAAHLPAMRQAAEAGNPWATNNLGTLYANGWGVRKDEAEAARWFRKAADQGNAVAQNNLASRYLNGTGVAKDEVEAARWYRKSAEAGYAGSQNNLGLLYENGQAVPKDLAEAAKWYRKAADQNFANAQYNLGRMYANGTGVGKDLTETARWYRKAADQNLALAQHYLGNLYASGLGLAKDEAEAVRWYRKAADQGLAVSQSALGVMLENGTGVGVDLAEAARWYRKAADQGDTRGEFQLGYCLANGRGVLEDAGGAVTWYRKAADKGYAAAQNNLGFMYEHGRGVEKDDAEAAKWYRKAADNGDLNGQTNLGLCYENGRGVAKDTAEAAKWLKKAADRGFEKAKKGLERLGM